MSCLEINGSEREENVQNKVSYSNDVIESVGEQRAVTRLFYLLQVRVQYVFFFWKFVIPPL